MIAKETPTPMLATVERVTELLTEGKSLILAGDEALLRALPRGAWIGGTIPYFMSREGGCSSRTQRRAGGSCGSRAAIPMCSAGAARSGPRAMRPAST